MFEPKIIAFLCNWCSYAGADLAGVSRFQYPTNARIIRVMCSGRIDPYFLIEALSYGADGILVTGCHLADCHYITGNYYTLYKIPFVKKLIEKVGIDSRRISLEWVSASEANRFRTVMTEYTDLIRELGPMSASSQKILQDDLGILNDICTDFNFRWLVGKSRAMIDVGNVYNKVMPKDEYFKLVDKIIDTELIRKRILRAIDDDALSAVEIAEKLSITPELVMNHVIALKTKQLVQIKMDGHDAKFEVIKE